MYIGLMHRTQIYLEDTQYRLLREKARRQGTSLASVIRQILEEHLAGRREKDEFASVIGIGEGDGSRVAENYEDYLYGSDS